MVSRFHIMLSLDSCPAVRSLQSSICPGGLLNHSSRMCGALHKCICQGRCLNVEVMLQECFVASKNECIMLSLK